MIDRRLAAVLISGLCMACVSTPATSRTGAVLVPSTHTSSWPVEGETSPGIWFRFESGPDSPSISELLNDLSLTVEHGSRQQRITGDAFAPVGDVTGLRQTRYMYLPRDGTLFITLTLGTPGRRFFPDTQRIELNGDCWHMLSYRVRGPVTHDQPYPPPFPRTVFLTAALSHDPQLYLEIFLSGNCFRNPLPPH